MYINDSNVALPGVDASPRWQVLARKYNLLISEVETPELTVENVRILIEAFRAEPRYQSGDPKAFIEKLCRDAKSSFEEQWKEEQTYWEYCEGVAPPDETDNKKFSANNQHYDDVINAIEHWSKAQCLKLTEMMEEACSQQFRFLNMSPAAIHGLLRRPA